MSIQRFLTFCAVALAIAPLAAQAKVRIVVTVTDLGAIAQEVAGDNGAVTVLARPTQDPHFVDARPNLMIDLNRADALVLIGADLEVGWLPVLLRGARNEKILSGQPGYIDASSFVPLKEVPTAKIERSMGDIHPSGNPHITTDPTNAPLIARGLAERLATIDVANAAVYRANAEKFAAATNARIATWKAALAPYKGTPAITYHRSWIYFTDFAGLEEAGTVEPKPGIPPNAKHVADLIALIRVRHIPLVLQESWYGSATSEIVARETGAKLVVVPGMAREGQPYLEHIDEVVKATVAALASKKT